MSQPNSTQQAESRPVRRPGWALIQDIHPHQKSRTTGVKQPLGLVVQAPLANTTHTAPQPTGQTPRNNTSPRFIQRYSLFLISPLVVIASIPLSRLPFAGELLIAFYGIAAVVRHIPSRISFWLATMVLAGVGIQFLFLSGTGDVGNGALFGFLLLGIGLLSSMLETRHLAAKERSLRRR